MADDYLKQMVCEAYYKGSVFLGGIPGQRLVMLANELSDNGNIEASMVLETEGGEPRFFSAEMSFDDGLKVLSISVRKGRNEDHNAKTDNQQCSEGCPVAESAKGTAAQAEEGTRQPKKR